MMDTGDTAFMLVAVAEVGKVIECIRQAAVTGKIGDGKIFVLPVEEAVRVRTGEKRTEAI